MSGLRSLSASEAADIVAFVQNDSPEGFATYYTLGTGCVFPAHAWEWIRTIYAGRIQGRGAAIEGFRGSRKTTYITNWFTSYQIGIHPERTNIFIQASEESATDNAKFVASILTSNNAFRLCFPHVVPDSSMGWGVEGYFVKRADMDYGEWRKRTSKDPTLIGCGYKAQLLIGKHPTGLLIIDDMHDHRNTRSMREFRYALEVHSKIVRYMPTETTWLIYIFTPWVDGDVGVWAKNNKSFVHARTPAYKEVDGKRTEEPTWPEVFPRDRLLQIENESGTAEFAQMMLLDLESAKGAVLKVDWLHYFPAENIIAKWPTYFGVDYASVASQQEKKHSKRDYFSLGVGRVQPGTRNLIVADGYYGHLTQPEAEDKVREFVNRYHPVRAGIEQLGKGEEFYHMLMRSGIKTHFSGQTVGNRSKAERFEIQMAPLFKQAVVWVSDEPQSPFLDEFRKEWLNWDGHERYYDDVLDSVWHLIRVCKTVIGLPEDDNSSDLTTKKKKPKKPEGLAAFGWRGRSRR
ncbi:MAG: hypothetical protein A2Y74_00975 [Actinobacteria bacterium RBG_13_63_9]|nr:MAG: hypothetical protein A2Y74_00975 [Actinobacteria bacterium RBG_13_63_9]